METEHLERFTTIYDSTLKKHLTRMFKKEFVKGWYIQSVQLDQEGKQWIIRWGRDPMALHEEND